MAISPFPDVVVQLLEAHHFVGQVLRLDAGEGFLSLTEVVNIVFGKVYAGEQLALVMLLGR